jgi:hypothetical protein
MRDIGGSASEKWNMGCGSDGRIPPSAIGTRNESLQTEKTLPELTI